MFCLPYGIQKKICIKMSVSQTHVCTLEIFIKNADDWATGSKNMTCAKKMWKLKSDEKWSILSYLEVAESN